MRCQLTTTSRTRTPWLGLVALGFLLATGCQTRPAQPLATVASVPAPATAVALAAPGPYARDVDLLRSTDFVARSRASERLVAAGERALPALGAAGDGSMHVLGTQEISTTTPVLRVILADLAEDRLVSQLDSPWSVLRRETASELGRRGRWRAVPYLLPRMDDEDARVRAASAASLRRLTNRFFGFDAAASLHARRRATERWREWWSVEGRVRAAEDAGGDAG